MKSNSSHPIWEGLKKLKKIWLIIMSIILILVSIGIFILKDFGLGYKYYEINKNETICIGTSMDKNLVLSTIEGYLESLESQGYCVNSFIVKKAFLEKQAIIPKSQVNEDDIKKEVIDNLSISVLMTRLSIKGDNTIYYFKTQTDCDNFVKELNKYIKQNITSEGIVDDYKKLTTKDILDKKIKNVKEQYEKQQAQRLKEKQLTSRSGTSRKRYNVPLESYVYISSYYGMRNGRMHTGVDFAAYAGTKIYAWKDGVITKASWNGSYGNFIEVKHNDGTISRYAHLSKYAVSKGQTVTKGQVIGYVGTTRKFEWQPFTL